MFCPDRVIYFGARLKMILADGQTNRRTDGRTSSVRELDKSLNILYWRWLVSFQQTLCSNIWLAGLWLVARHQRKWCSLKCQYSVNKVAQQCSVVKKYNSGTKVLHCCKEIYQWKVCAIKLLTYWIFKIQSNAKVNSRVKIPKYITTQDLVWKHFVTSLKN